MKPSLANHLVKIFLSPNSRILDPFSGVGTIPFEAALNGHTAFGFEISPAAMAISAAKLSRGNKEKTDDVIKKLEAFIEAARGKVPEQDLLSAEKIKFNGKLENYFHKQTFHEILLARSYFRSNPPRSVDENLVLSCLLHILHGNRPYALSRRSHPITPFAPTGEFSYRPLIGRLREKVRRSIEIEYPETFMEGQVFFTDATSWWPQGVNQLDAVITSPPFFDSTRFHLGNWMRLWFCGWDKEDFSSKPLAFVDERQKSSLAIYEPIFQQSRERLKTGGVLVMHLGLSKKCNMGEELSRISKRWFRTADLFSECASKFESHGIRDKGTVTEHQYLVLQ